MLISGAFAGLAGGYLSIELVGLYREGMNQGRGFIALAALILGNWSPIGAAFACLLFAWTEALTVFLRVDWINNAFIQSLPYIVTLVVLALFSRRVRPPRPSARPTKPAHRSDGTSLPAGGRSDRAAEGVALGGVAGAVAGGEPASGAGRRSRGSRSRG